MPSKAPSPASPPNARGAALSLTLIALLVALLIGALSSGVNPNQPQLRIGSVFLGLFLVALGCMFLAGYFYAHTSYFLRALAWFCEYASFPNTRKMAFVWFLLFSGLGAWEFAVGLGLL